jgi:serine/threonine-protein kinase
MPPEQAQGDIAHLDRRADVFGLGAILCEILTGQPPYVGRSVEEVRRKACNGDLAEATARLEACGADAELIALTRSCLAAEASDRPKDAQAVADGLTAYLDGVQERLHQAELAEAEARAKAAEEAKRRRLTLALAGTVLLALTLGGGGWLYVKSDRDARQAQVTRDVNEALNKATGFREQAKAAPVGSAALFAQAREQAQRALALVENGPAEAALAAQVRQLQADLDEEEKDRQLLAALDEARLAQAETLSENRFALERAVPRFREAFRAYGLPPGEGEPKDVAERIRQRPAAVQAAIVDALDEWDALAADKKPGVTEPHPEWLRAVLGAAEPAEGWMRQFRVAREEKDEARRKTALEKLAAADDVGTLPVRALTRLAWQLEKVEAYASAARLLRRAQQQYPADFWVNHRLGMALKKVTPPEWGEAVRFLTAALALRPESPGACVNVGAVLCDHKRDYDGAIACFQKALALDPKYAAAHDNLGAALAGKGQVDAAIASCRKAIELNPKLANAHNGLGTILCDRKHDYDAAIASFRTAIELDPKHANAHNNLGTALHGKGQVDEAITCHRRAIALDPKLPLAHRNLGKALKAKGQLDEAIACYKEAIALDPKYTAAYTSLGVALKDKGQLDEAIVCFRKAVELAPTEAFAHTDLGWALSNKGQLDEAIACFQKAIALDPKFAGARTELAKAERLAATRDKFAAFQNGSYTPANNEERLGLTEWCLIKKLHHTATGLYAAAFAADPKLAADLRALHRYNAACYAALAAAGQGEDAAKLDDQERTRLRQQALDWLRADLALYRRQLETGNLADRAAVQGMLKHWQQDTDLAGIRDKAALAKLSPQERAACEKLWADVAALLKKAQTPAQKETNP